MIERQRDQSRNATVDQGKTATELLSSSSIGTTATIWRLSIERFRGVRSMLWRPGRGLNVILGGGDVGKTTILDAIGLLLSPVQPATVADSDYFGRCVADGFEIEAVMSLPASSGILDQGRTTWPWVWNGLDPAQPSTDEEPGVPVYRLRVRGTEDLELVYEILRPDGETDVLPVRLRRSIGLVRLAGDDRNDRDLRLVSGSALDRLLSDKSLRSRLTSKLAKSEVTEELLEPARTALGALDEAFQERSLPTKLDLEITAAQGLSIASLIGLTADRGGVQLPIASWGAGTRRMAALAIAEQKQDERPVTLIDEIERGLEPYRQRALLDRLQASGSQVFLTTHSAAALQAALTASLWYVGLTQEVGGLDSKKIGHVRLSDPHTFLSRLTIVAEGSSEVGFVTELLERALGGPLPRFGVHISDGGGHERTLDLLEALLDGGITFGGFVDNEHGQYQGRWTKLQDSLGPMLFRWAAGCLEENIFAEVPDAQLEIFMEDPSGDGTGMRRHTIAARLGVRGATFTEVAEAAGSTLKDVMIQAAIGVIPEGVAEPKSYKSHGRVWFKTEAGGRELATKVFALGLWRALSSELLPFCNAVRAALAMPDIEDVAA